MLIIIIIMRYKFPLRPFPANWLIPLQFLSKLSLIAYIYLSWYLIAYICLCWYIQAVGVKTKFYKHRAYVLFRKSFRLDGISSRKQQSFFLRQWMNDSRAVVTLIIFYFEALLNNSLWKPLANSLLLKSTVARDIETKFI